MNDKHARKVDRRILRTQKQLHAALFQLVTERGRYDNLTVQDIVERADIARVTFYTHYQDKDQLLLDSLSTHYNALADVPAPNPSDDLMAQTIAYQDRHWHMIDEQVAFYRIMLGQGGSILFFDSLWGFWRKTYEQALLLPCVQKLGKNPPLALGLVAECLTAWHVAILQWRLKGDLNMTNDAQNAMIQASYRYGVEGLLDTTLWQTTSPH